MSDREPGVFYIIHRYEIEVFNPRGWYNKYCIEYYRDYGETLVDTYCHDITKDYKNGVGVKEIEEIERIVVYPNPTTGELRIMSYELRINNIEVFDIVGKNQKSEIRRQNEIDISDLSAGIYFVRVTTEKGTTTKIIIKQ
jgi:hypothetical protein